MGCSLCGSGEGGRGQDGVNGGTCVKHVENVTLGRSMQAVVKTNFVGCSKTASSGTEVHCGQDASASIANRRIRG
jgi:hypothetical protein